MKTKIGLIQPKDFGDIIALQGLAHYLKVDQWPVCEFISPICEHFPYFDWIELDRTMTWNKDHWEKANNALQSDCIKIYDGMIHGIYQEIKRLNVRSMYVDQIKYHQLEVPFEEKYKKFVWKRIKKRENELYDYYVTEKKYCVVHEYWGNDYKNRQIKQIELETDLPIIRFEPLAGYTIMDWYKICANAEVIHCVDSGPGNMIDLTNIQVEKHLHLDVLKTTNAQPDILNGFSFSNGWIKHFFPYAYN